MNNKIVHEKNWQEVVDKLVKKAANRSIPRI